MRIVAMTWAAIGLMALGCAGPGCGDGGCSKVGAPGSSGAGPTMRASSGAVGALRLPLQHVADIPLPGGASRFDYQALDLKRGRLVVAHMNDASVVVVDLAKRSVIKHLDRIPTPRGLVVADEVDRIFVTSSPSKLVVIDGTSLEELGRVDTGRGPDGVAWDPADSIVGVSDQGDGAVSLIESAGHGARRQLRLGDETGNIVFDPGRALFWVTVVKQAHGRLVSVDPRTASVIGEIAIPGCDGAHGLEIASDGTCAFVACEDNDLLARVELDGSHAVATESTGSGPDVLALDPDLGWLYIAAESGDLVVFDVRQKGLVALDHEHPGDHAHSVAVDPSTHLVYFPLQTGDDGTPVLRVMRPTR